MTLKGSCLCGEVKFEIEGDYEHFFICHCRYCQKDTGSAYAANLFIKSGSFNWLSGQEKVKDFNLSSTRHVKSFCSECGSAVPNTKMGSGTCIVPAGCLDDEVQFKPQAHIFAESQANWEKELKSIKCFPGFPL